MVIVHCINGVLMGFNGNSIAFNGVFHGIFDDIPSGNDSRFAIDKWPSRNS